MKKIIPFFVLLLLLFTWVGCAPADPNLLADEYLKTPYRELNMTDKQRKNFPEMAKAMDAYTTGDFANATAQFKAIIDSYKDEGVSYFYMGLSQVYTQKYPECIDSFQKSIDFKPELYDYTCNWYSALAYIKMQQYDKAVPHLNYILEHDLDKPLYKDNARKLLNAMKK